MENVKNSDLMFTNPDGKKKENSQIELWIWRIVTPVLSILIISFTFIWHISKQIVEKASQFKNE